MSSHPRPPLVLGCHHKTGSVLLTRLMDQLGPRLSQKLRLNRIVSGSPIDRKAPLSEILNHYRGCDCYVNLWFEHEIDVAPNGIRLVHFVRHPVKWVRSAYLYHKKGAPSDSIRWVDWRVFRFKDAQLSYCEVLNRLDAGLGLVVETVRSFPEIIGTARVARTSSELDSRQQFSLEQVHESFDSSIARFCNFIGFNQSDTDKLVGELKHLDLSVTDSGSLPPNVTRTSSESSQLEFTLEQEPSFSRLFANAAADMGYGFSDTSQKETSILPDSIVNALREETTHITTHWQTAERTKEFMRQQGADKWWTAHILQVPGCGHLMMYSFIQQFLDTLQ